MSDFIIVWDDNEGCQVCNSRDEAIKRMNELAESDDALFDMRIAEVKQWFSPTIDLKAKEK